SIFNQCFSHFFNISDPALFIYFGLLLFFTLVSTIPTTYLQGLLRFKAFSFLILIASFLRFALPTALIFAGYHVRGVFIGLIDTSVISYLISTLLLKKNFKAYVAEDLSPYYKQLLLFS